MLNIRSQLLQEIFSRINCADGDEALVLAVGAAAPAAACDDDDAAAAADVEARELLAVAEDMVPVRRRPTEALLGGDMGV